MGRFRPRRESHIRLGRARRSRGIRQHSAPIPIPRSIRVPLTPHPGMTRRTTTAGRRHFPALRASPWSLTSTATAWSSFPSTRARPISTSTATAFARRPVGCPLMTARWSPTATRTAWLTGLRSSLGIRRRMDSRRSLGRLERDGRIDTAYSAFAMLRVWRDLNGDARTADELFTPQEAVSPPPLAKTASGLVVEGNDPVPGAYETTSAGWLEFWQSITRPTGRSHSGRRPKTSRSATRRG